MTIRFFNLAFSLLGKLANCTHQTLKQFHFLNRLPLVSSEYKIRGHMRTSRPCAVSLTWVHKLHPFCLNKRTNNWIVYVVSLKQCMHTGKNNLYTSVAAHHLFLSFTKTLLGRKGLTAVTLVTRTSCKHQAKQCYTKQGGVLLTSSPASLSCSQLKNSNVLANRSPFCLE